MFGCPFACSRLLTRDPLLLPAVLRAIAGAETLLSGEHQLGEGAKIGYFVQDLAQELPLDKPALEYVLDTAREDDPNITTEEGRKALGALGLLGDTPLRRIGELSGGEKSRVALARFALVSNNVLLLGTCALSPELLLLG